MPPAAARYPRGACLAPPPADAPGFPAAVRRDEERRGAGESVSEALRRAVELRTRPILLTAIAIILGTLVMIFDPVFGGLAISLIYGTFASTVLTLFVIPLVYYGYCRRIAPNEPLRALKQTHSEE